MTKVNVFWFRRDIRISDNTALRAALQADLPVLVLFIFDESILGELPKDDPRVNFIYDELLSHHHYHTYHQVELHIMSMAHLLG